MKYWPHQIRAFEEIDEALRCGYRRICVTAPTGTGKTKIITRLTKDASEAGKYVAIFTHRRILHDQLADCLTAEGIQFGVRASGHVPSHMDRVQLSMVQTENARVYSSGKWSLHPADLIITDEKHLLGGAVMQRIADDMLDNGCRAEIGFTATPLGIGHACDHLITACSVSEGRSCGALLPAHHYAPDEPDTRQMKGKQLYEWSENNIRKVMRLNGVIGRIISWFHMLNPDQKPAIVFAPGVAESIWLCQQFNRQGIPAAHIDGKQIYLRGQWHSSSDERVRDDLKKASEGGDVKVVCNRFVLREGIDWPHLYHAIFATIFSSLASYLQAGGRILRNHPTLNHVIIQDHGGNWWRHSPLGDLNADKEWTLGSCRDERIAMSLAHDAMRGENGSKEPEPYCCYNCGAVIFTKKIGAPCYYCGYTTTRRVRRIMQTDGTMYEMQGDIFKARRRRDGINYENDWRRMYYRSIKAGRTFAAAEALFAKEHGWWYPPRTFPLMPRQPADWYRLVKDVPPESLTYVPYSPTTLRDMRESVLF